MAARLPTIRKSWRFVNNVNVAAATDLLARAGLLYEIKRRLTGDSSLTWTGLDGAATTPHTPWIVRASSNGSVANTSDNWTSSASLVWAVAPVAHSWIVLRRTDYFAVGSHLEICIDLSQASSSDRNAAIGFIVSRTGFTLTGLVTTARPTAVDERICYPSTSTATNATWCGSTLNNTESLSARLHYQAADDGRHVRFIIQRAGNSNAFFELFAPDDAPSGWTLPYIVRFMGTPSQVENITTLLSLYSTTVGVRNFANDSVLGNFAMAMAIPLQTGVIGSTQIQSQDVTTIAANNFDNSRQLEPCGLYGITPSVGKMATIPDWWVGIAADATADHADGSGGAVRQYAAIGDFWIPWDRSQMLSS